jgi:hypothetical protein
VFWVAIAVINLAYAARPTHHGDDHRDRR